MMPQSKPLLHLKRAVLCGFEVMKKCESGGLGRFCEMMLIKNLETLRSMDGFIFLPLLCLIPLISCLFQGSCHIADGLDGITKF